MYVHTLCTCTYVHVTYVLICRHTDTHLLLVWSVTVSLLIFHSKYLKDAPAFSRRLLSAVQRVLVHPNTSGPLFQSLALGLEHLLLNFSLGWEERGLIKTTAVSRLPIVRIKKNLNIFLMCSYISNLPTDDPDNGRRPERQYSY